MVSEHPLAKGWRDEADHIRNNHPGDPDRCDPDTLDECARRLEGAVGRPQEPPERVLLALAQQGAMYLHDCCLEATASDPLSAHQDPFHKCLHPDCELVRALGRVPPALAEVATLQAENRGLRDQVGDLKETIRAIEVELDEMED